VHTTTDIVLPCLDEAAALPWVLARIPSWARAIVVDNGSRDDSAAIARDLGATVVPCAVPGYGAACHAGLEAATAEVVAVCDCDASIDPGVIAAFVVALDHADLAVARRRPVSRAAWSLPARLANRELARRVSRRSGVTLSDLGPVRVARRSALLALDVRDRRSGYSLETVLRAAEAGWRIVQLDVPYHPRIGRSKVTGTVGGYLRAVRDMSAVLAS
jgi:glycosyltransferase involved in cell wall biosynthesis